MFASASRTRALPTTLSIALLSWAAACAEPHGGNTPGVHVAHYTLSPTITSMPDFEILPADSVRNARIIEISELVGSDYFGLVFSGKLYIPEGGAYGFRIIADDTARLFIDGQLIVDNDLPGESTAEGNVSLAGGYHPFVLQYFEATGDERLELLYRRGIEDFAPVPDTVLFLPDSPIEVGDAGSPDASMPPCSSTLSASEQLDIGEFACSENGLYRFGLDGGGDLVLTQGQSVLWQANVSGGVFVRMQTDGNLVVRDAANAPVWATNTAMNPGAHLEVQNDGNVVLVHDSVVIWDTGTGP